MSKQEVMFQLADEYRSSGLSAKAFALKNEIPVGTFSYWIRKKRSLDNMSNFIELRSPRPAGPIEVELIFPNGVQLRMHGSDPALIARLVQLPNV